MGLFDTIGGLLTGKTKAKPQIGLSTGLAANAAFGPIAGTAVGFLVDKYVASKPQATNTAAQSAQLAKKPLQTNTIAPQTAIPSPEANSQGSGNASI